MPIVSGAGQKYWGHGLPFDGMAKATGLGGTRYFYADFLVAEGTLAIEVTGSGSYVFGGIAVIDAVTYSVSYSVISTGGYLLGGDARFLAGFITTGSGELTFGAAADIYTEYSLLVGSSGGYAFGGEALTSFDFNFVAAAGLLFGGSAGFAIPSDLRYMMPCSASTEDAISTCEVFLGDGNTAPRSGLCRWGTTESYPEDSEWA